MRLPKAFTGTGLAVIGLTGALVFGAWAFTLERIGYERGEEVDAAQRANAAAAIAYEERTLRELGAGKTAGGKGLAERFAAFGDHLGLGAATTVELIAMDGRVLARRSADGGPDAYPVDGALLEAARAWPQGSLVLAEGTPRYVSYRTLPGRPLVVAVSTSVNRALLVFRAREEQYLRNAWIATVLVLLFGIGLFVALLRERAGAERLVYQAHYDTLTDLPNRLLCFDRLAHAIGQAPRRGACVAVLFFDIDRFKTVNDTLGHGIGDAVLRETARRLTGCVRAGDTVARVGGDEFVVILGELARPQDAAAVAQKMLETVLAPMRIEGHEVFTSASIGIAVHPDDGESGEALVKNADAAMFSAKQAGRNTARFYTAAMNERAMENMLLENDLRRALERGEFRLYFQPKEDLAQGGTAGLEALVRWQHPERGLLSPARFLPVLQDSGLIVQVGEWILRAACAQVRDWQQAGIPAVPVAVNVAARQILHRDVATVIDEALAASGIEPALLEIEITESDAMERPDQIVPVLRRLRDRGVRVSVDDFGTGYSSLSYLKRLPVDTVKIDRSFVDGLPNDKEDAPIVRAIIAMAHTLGLKVVAEGVETPAQRSFLAALGCEEAQGFLYAAPMPAEECGRFLTANSAQRRAAVA
jgi:diguanylate cyclase (GGDEF)-like protein